MSAAAFQMIEGVPTYNLFIGGEWVPSSRNEGTASHNPAIAAPRLQFPGASRAAIIVITKHVARSTATCASIAARVDGPATANTEAKNAGYPGTRMSTGVNCPYTGNPYTPFFSQFQASSM